MSSGLLDSSILIHCLRGRTDALAFVGTLAAGGPPLTHVMVAAELLTGARDKREQGLIDSYLNGFHVVASTEADGFAALDLYRRYRLSHAVDWPDCVIAATAVRMGVRVYTQNLKHFGAFTTLQAVRPY